MTMRRADRQIHERAEIDAIIRGSEVCRVAFAIENEPYIVPLSFGYDGSALYFHTAQDGKKIDCIRANPRVCFEFERNVEVVEHPTQAHLWTFAYESVIGYGVVDEITGEREKLDALNQIMLQYSGRRWDIASAAARATRVWRLAIESMTGKRSVKKQHEQIVRDDA